MNRAKVSSLFCYIQTSVSGFSVWKPFPYSKVLYAVRSQQPRPFHLSRNNQVHGFRYVDLGLLFRILKQKGGAICHCLQSSFLAPSLLVIWLQFPLATCFHRGLLSVKAYRPGSLATLKYLDCSQTKSGKNKIFNCVLHEAILQVLSLSLPHQNNLIYLFQKHRILSLASKLEPGKQYFSNTSNDSLLIIKHF